MYEGMSEVERTIVFNHRVASERFQELFENMFSDCIWRIMDEAYWASSSNCPLAGAAWRSIAKELLAESRLTKQELDELRALGLERAKAEKALAELEERRAM